MNTAEFSKYLEPDKKPDINATADIEELLRKYPCSSILRMLYVKMLMLSGSRYAEEYLQTAAVYCNDRKKLFCYMNDIRDEVFVQQPVPAYTIEMEEYGFAEIAANENDPISKFLSEKPNFIMKKEISDEADEPAYDPGIVSETLAEIYVKQGKADKALNTYEKLCLKFPEKSSYFAARIEKIKKGN